MNKGKISLLIRLFQGKFRCNTLERSCSLVTNKIYLEIKSSMHLKDDM